MVGLVSGSTLIWAIIACTSTCMIALESTAIAVPTTSEAVKAPAVKAEPTNKNSLPKVATDIDANPAAQAQLSFHFQDTHIFMERSLPTSRHGYSKKGRVSPDTQHQVTFATKHKNLDKLETILYAVSDPKSDKYGSFLTAAEISDISNTKEACQTVLRHLQTSCGGNDSSSSSSATAAAAAAAAITINSVSTHGEYITATSSVGCWEEVFNTTFFSFSSNSHRSPPMVSASAAVNSAVAGKNRRDIDEEEEEDAEEGGEGEERDDYAHLLVRAESYSLPTVLTPHVHAVFDTVHFPVLSSFPVAVSSRKQQQQQTKVSGIRVLRGGSNYTADEVTTTTTTATYRRSLRAKCIDSSSSSTANNSNSGSSCSSSSSSSDSSSESPLSRSLAGGNEFNTITPEILFDYYNIDPSLGNGLASQAVYQTVGQYFSPRDLALFHEQQSLRRLDSNKIFTTVEKFKSDDKCKKKPDRCVEGNLDMQYLTAVAQNTPTTFWYVGAEDSFLGWIKQIAAQDQPPLVHAIAYGANEHDVSAAYMQQFNTEAMKLGLRGVTILASSGDDGAPGHKARDAQNEGNSNGQNAQCGYAPTFPASLPFVTAVGATAGAEEGRDVETVCSSRSGNVATSGGGFSDLFSTPEYQKKALQAYKQQLKRSFPNKANRPLKGYNKKGRMYPDISVAGNRYEMIIGGELRLVSGTSCSVPTMAGIMSLANSALLAKNKPPLGFINPLLYEMADQFVNDVVSGDNRCTATGEVPKACCREGFDAMPGFDLTTGWGSIDFARFLNTVMSIKR